MTGILRLCGVTILGLCATLILREKNKAFAVFAAAATMVTVFCTVLTGEAAAAVQSLAQAAADSGFSQYAALLLRALGVAYLSTFTAELCRGAGEGMLAQAATLAGKAELILLSLPMVSRLLEIAAELL